jgi:hypothetical protein
MGERTGWARKIADLPAFVVLQDNPTPVINGPRNWSAGFMPAAWQGTRINPWRGADSQPEHSARRDVSDERQRGKLAFLDRLNRQVRRAASGAERTGGAHRQL